MRERSSSWVTVLGTVAVFAGALFAVGCGRYDGYAEYPQQYQAVPAPPTAAELAAQQEARQRAQAADREVLIGANDDEYTDTDPSALTEFKPVLQDHGAWVEDDTYGTVWVPSQAEVGTDFQPYVTAGHWTYSESTDYVWVSDYSWGWAPFHYGRWVYLAGHGWSWIPGRRYSGAWVTWRVGPSGYGYVGWAPAPPAWYWYHGVAYGWSFGFYDYHHHYVYCPRDYFYHGQVNTYVARGSAARPYDGRTQDYIPASPSVGGGDRVVATPTVNGGGDRVIASPSVGDRVVANPRVGPRPSELGIGKEAVLAPPAADPGLSRAQIFATPKTAVLAGAAAPASARAASVPTPVDRESVLAAPGREPPAIGRGPATPSLVPSSPPSVARPSAPGPTVATPSVPSLVPSTPSYSVPPSSYRPVPPTVSAARPSSIYGPPSMSSGPPPSALTSPSVRSPSYSPRVSSPAFRSSPSYSPSFRSPPPTVSSPRVSSPSFRSSPGYSSPSFRSPPPTVSSPRVSAPRSVASPTLRAPGSSPASRSLSSPRVRR